MAKLYPIFHQEVPAFRELCEYLKRNLLDPILREGRLPLAHINVDSKLSLQQSIKEAIRIEEISDADTSTSPSNPQ